ncbi:hypothetical protein G7077_02250 [Sphingomonas piscis]|uniref:Uncharacterized protein n=1 Tax=Sphingomonas piscis TaxID=2714943 RepID=A0A6G7YMD6_9SPHN|nr:hypothetical protein [Sphingomonas piscis]QIK77910.1 hypothetical protein G7077_02250 [Sphingomonas piscis]
MSGLEQIGLVLLILALLALPAIGTVVQRRVDKEADEAPVRSDRSDTRHER